MRPQDKIFRIKNLDDVCLDCMDWISNKKVDCNKCTITLLKKESNKILNDEFKKSEGINENNKS